MKTRLGSIVSGSLADGLLMRLDAGVPATQFKTGKFVCIDAGATTFFSLVTDIRLEVTHPDITIFPPADGDTLLLQTLKKRDVYATASLRPMIALQGTSIGPVKTIPPHFAAVYDAREEDVSKVFGSEKDPSKRYFHVGVPLDMTTPVCLDLERFTERSNGIFGKTGTGKTFLTRLVLAGLIKNNKAVTIIFDMHSEYGLQARKEGAGHFVKGLKTLFGEKIAIFSLDPVSTRRRGGSPDVEVVLSYEDIGVEDVLSLQNELNVHPTALEAAYLIAAKYKSSWLAVLLAQGDRLKEFAQEVGAHPESIAALYRKLKRIERLPFLSSKATVSVIDRMMEYIDRGINVIVEFGNHSSTFVYLLIANIITRRIHELYVRKTEDFLGSHKPQDEPKKLMICIEEAHKFLNPAVAQQTIFGIIAREMRKYYVSLLVVDQRPSGIDAEVLSQLGTKIIAQLQDDADISAALTGVAGAAHVRGILASLDTKKQAVILGHAVAMPVVIQTREYDDEFYKSMMSPVDKKSPEELMDELFR